MKKAVLTLFAFCLCVVFVLFFINGVILAQNEMPDSGSVPGSNPTNFPYTSDSVKVIAFNIAKCFVHKKTLKFEDPKIVTERLDRIAKIIKNKDPDFVFLSEIVSECTPVKIRQVEYLAEKTGLTQWVFGENFNFGLPFYRMVSGNAILSKWKISAVDNPSLSGRKPFYVTKNNRRVLWCETLIWDRKIRLASIHTDSFVPANNLAQTSQILAYDEKIPTILAGDFNAEPQSESIQLIQNTHRFSGRFDGEPTFPSDAPTRRIDYIFGPKAWDAVGYEIIKDDASDHFAVYTSFRVNIPADVAPNISEE